MLEWIIFLLAVAWGILMQMQISNIREELDLEALDKDDYKESVIKLGKTFEKEFKRLDKAISRK